MHDLVITYLSNVYQFYFVSKIENNIFTSPSPVIAVKWEFSQCALSLAQSKAKSPELLKQEKRQAVSCQERNDSFGRKCRKEISKGNVSRRWESWKWSWITDWFVIFDLARLSVQQRRKLGSLWQWWTASRKLVQTQGLFHQA